MSYLDKLKQSRNKSQVAYQEFALHTRQDKDGLFCFFDILGFDIFLFFLAVL